MKEFESIKLQLNNFLTQFMKGRLGRGPKNIDIKITENIVVYFVTGILSPMELVLIQTPEGERAALESRRIYVKDSSKERIPHFEKIIQQKAVDHYETWNFQKDTAVGIVVFEKDIES